MFYCIDPFTIKRIKDMVKLLRFFVTFIFHFHYKILKRDLSYDNFIMIIGLHVCNSYIINVLHAPYLFTSVVYSITDNMSDVSISNNHAASQC